MDNYLLGITCEWANSVVSLVKFGNVVLVRQQRLALGKGSKLFIIQNVENDLEQVALAETMENAISVLEGYDDNGETARKALGVSTTIRVPEGDYIDADYFEGYAYTRQNGEQVLEIVGYRQGFSKDTHLTITNLAVFPATTL